MRKKLEITKFEHKITGAGKPYIRFQTNEGWMSCWDSVISEKLQELIGKSVEMDITEKPGQNFKGEDIVYKNIIGIVGECEDIDKVVVEKVGVPQETKVSKPNEIQVGVYTSYAKDIFVALHERANLETQAEITNMALAIKLVKQAKEAFE